MKYFLLLGGFAGFVLTFAAGLIAGSTIDRVLVDATIGCLIGATLMRGFRHLYINSLRTVVVERSRRHAEATETEAATTQTA